MTSNLKFVKESIVTDASSIISLERAKKGHEYLQTLFSKVYIPTKAMTEVVRKPPVSFESYLTKWKIDDIVEIVSANVDTTLQDIWRLYDYKKDMDFEGEAYAISLALQKGLRILIDDTTANTIAVKNGLQVYNFGTYTIRAYRKGFIDFQEAETMLLEFREAEVYHEKRYKEYLEILKKQ